MRFTSGDHCSNELLEAEEHIWSHTFSFVTSTALKCALELGIPDVIADHEVPITISELVARLSIPEAKSSHLYRLMRILTHNGFFNVLKDGEGDQERYTLTSSSRALVKGGKTNLTPFVLMMLDPAFVSPCLFTSDWFKSGEASSSSFESVHGTGLYNYFGDNPDASKRFNTAMACDSELATRVLLSDCRHMFEGYGSLVDVAGGTGTVAKAIARAFPHLTCTVYDLPHVIRNVEESDNVQLVAGDMFASIPSANIVLLKNILQDWSDEECVKILKCARNAIKQEENGGKVIILDMVILENGVKGSSESTKTQLCFDVFKMALAPGKERAESEWEKLFLQAGFKSYQITPALGLRSVIEVFP